MGQLSSQAGNGFAEDYYYDPLSRLSQLESSISGMSGKRSFYFDYDAYSRDESTTYPSGLIVENQYHSSGIQMRMLDARIPTNKRVLWALGSESDERGTLTDELYGNGIVTRKSYSPKDGLLKSIQSGRLSEANTIAQLNGDIQNLEYTFDGIGNLYSRSTKRTNSFGVLQEDITESFTYDLLNRVRGAVTNGSFNRDNQFDYDKIGNLTYRTGKGDLLYEQTNGAGVHAITSSGGINSSSYKDYHYDPYGNMVQRGEESLTYDVFNKPIRISGPQGLTEFYYGPNHQRYKQVSANTTTFVVNGGAYEEVVENGFVIRKSYVGGFLVLSESEGLSELTYLHGDHIGSVEAMTDEYGSLIDRMSFDVWGERQTSDWRTGRPTQDDINSYPTTMGFTGHEQLDDHDLIHMGGRVYDPLIGRFLSTDVMVQAPFNTQSYNRYSYVFNNPLSFVDPSGYECQTVYTRATEESEPVAQQVNCDFGENFFQRKMPPYVNGFKTEQWSNLNRAILAVRLFMLEQRLSR